MKKLGIVLTSLLILTLILGSIACSSGGGGEQTTATSRATPTPRIERASIIKEFASPSSFPAGLSWDGKYLWYADFNGERIYIIDPDNGMVIKSFKSPGRDPEGLAWDGKQIWHVDNGNAFDLGCKQAKIYVFKIDPESGDAIRMFEGPGPGCNCEDLAWDGEYLWYVDGGWDTETEGTSTIYKLDPQTGTVVKSFDAPGPYPYGLTWDGAYLWLTDYDLAKIYKIDPENGRVLQSVNAPSGYPVGLAWDGEYLWYADGKSNKIYCVDMIMSE